jgi:uncharacterized protein
VMTPQYIKRSIEPILKRAASEFPALVLTGPRQSGKTTILRHLFGTKCRYASLEPPDIRAAAVQDPRGFLSMYPPPLILDEVQYAPDLLSYVKEQIDEQRDRAGQYLITGSQNILLTEKVTESLAGRAAMLRLLPMSRREIEGHPQALLPWESGYRKSGQARKRGASDPSSARQTGQHMWTNFLRGGYPELVSNPNRDIGLWHASYIQTYLERDVRTIRQVGDLSQFQIFLRALAARTGQLLNLTDLAKDLGVALNTIKAWISVLEATYQIIILRPYFFNIGKRLVKTPKIYFTDAGTLCYLTGLKDPEHAASGPMGGAIMETVVLSEIIKTLTSRGIDPQVYFWRTSVGTEVDIVVESGSKLIPIEVKLSATPRSSMAASVKSFQEDMGNKALAGYVVHSGKLTLPLGSNVTALPIADL